MKRTMTIVAGVIGVLVGTGFVMPAMAQLRDRGAWGAEGVALLLLGLAMTLGGVAATAYAAMRLRT
jgi:hypothetical protein